jgi:hypothetical protein
MSDLLLFDVCMPCSRQFSPSVACLLCLLPCRLLVPAVLLHLLFSTFLWMPSYYSKLWDNTDVAVVPALNGTKFDKFGMMKTSTVPTGLQVVFDDTTHHYDTANSTVLSTWPVAGPMKVQGGAGPLNASHPVELLTTVTNIITLRSKLNWIGESSTLLGIISGAG